MFVCQSQTYLLSEEVELWEFLCRYKMFWELTNTFLLLTMGYLIFYLIFFLNNFSVYHCTRNLWIHVTRISFYLLVMTLWECGKLYQSKKEYESRIYFEYLNKSFLYNTVLSELIWCRIQRMAHDPWLVKIKSCIFRFIISVYGKRSYKCSIWFPIIIHFEEK